MVKEMLTRRYRVPLPMMLLVCLVPFYIFIPEFLTGRTFYVPELALDRILPVQPMWMLAYGPLYWFLIFLPVLVVRQDALLRRAVFAYLLVWIVSYIFFVVYPTTASRPVEINGTGFGAWSLGLIYAVDPPHNCFPSLHVAHSYVSALVLLRVNRRVGIAALLAASLVGLSAVLVKQHYVIDVIAGALLAGIAYAMFLRGGSCPVAGESDRRVAPVIAVGLFATFYGLVAIAWLLHGWALG